MMRLSGRAGAWPAGACRHRPRRLVRLRGEPSLGRAGPFEAGQARREIDLTPFGVAPLRLQLGEAREHGTDEAVDALGRTRIGLRSGREQHHAGGDRRHLAARPDQIGIVRGRRAASADRPLPARAPKGIGKRWMPALTGMALDQRRRLAADDHQRRDIAPCLSCSMADIGIEVQNLDLDPKRLEQRGRGDGGGRSGGSEIHLPADELGHTADIGTGEDVDLLRARAWRPARACRRGSCPWPLRSARASVETKARSTRGSSRRSARLPAPVSPSMGRTRSCALCGNRLAMSAASTVSEAAARTGDQAEPSLGGLVLSRFAAGAARLRPHRGRSARHRERFERDATHTPYPRFTPATRKGSRRGSDIGPETSNTRMGTASARPLHLEAREPRSSRQASVCALRKPRIPGQKVFCC